jgi:hypothetical protein
MFALKHILFSAKINVVESKILNKMISINNSNKAAESDEKSFKIKLT